MEVIVPDGKSGSWKVETFTVNSEQSEFTRIRALINGEPSFYVPSGTYKRLVYTSLAGRSVVVMSNTPMEVDTCRGFVNRARGKIFINGLGFGMVLQAILQKPEVEHVTVVEKEPDVIDLVWPSFQNESRAEIIHADALEFNPDRRAYYDVVWHDIWPTISGDNLRDMKKLHRKYNGKCAWQASWRHDSCERLHRKSCQLFG